MSLLLPCMYHWSPHHLRADIHRGGLHPRTPSGLVPGRQGTQQGVCLGTSPSHAWSLVVDPWSRSQVWDLWQVVLEADDCTIFRPSEMGNRLDEVRVLNKIEPDRIWLVAERDRQHQDLDDEKRR